MKKGIGEENEFCLQIVSKTKEYIADKEEKDLVETAVRTVLKGLNDKSDVSEELYDYLNCFTLFQENAADERTIAAWDAIIDAVAIVCKNAYIEADAEYFPEPIELVDEDTFDHMIKSFLSVSESNLEISIRGEKN